MSIAVVALLAEDVQIPLTDVDRASLSTSVLVLLGLSKRLHAQRAHASESWEDVSDEISDDVVGVFNSQAGPAFIYVYRSGEYDVYLGVWFPMGSPAILTVCWTFPVF